MADDPTPKVVIEKKQKSETVETKKSSSSVWIAVALMSLIVLGLAGGGLGYLLAKHQKKKRREIADNNYFSTEQEQETEPESDPKSDPKSDPEPKPEPKDGPEKRNDNSPKQQSNSKKPNQTKAKNPNATPNQNPPANSNESEQRPNAPTNLANTIKINFSKFEIMDMGTQAIETTIGTWKANQTKRIKLGTNSKSDQLRVAFYDGPDNHLILTLSDKVDPNGVLKIQTKRNAPLGTKFSFQIAVLADGKEWIPLELPSQPKMNRSQIAIKLKHNPTKIRFTCNGTETTKEIKRWNCGMLLFQVEMDKAKRN